MSLVQRTERFGACLSLVVGLTLAPALSRADFSTLTDSSEIPGLKTFIDSEGLAFWQITDPAALQPDSVFFPDAPDLVVFLGDNSLIEVPAAPAGNTEIRAVFDDLLATTEIGDVTATQLTFIAYSDEFATSIGSTTSVGSAGFFGSGVGAEDALIKSVMTHDKLGSLIKGQDPEPVAGPVPAPGAVVLGAVGLGLVGWIGKRQKR